MILQALVKHYETLAEDGKVSRRGWCHAKVSFALNLAEDGRLKGVIDLKLEDNRGKKQVWVPRPIEVPEMVSRSSGVSSNFLCDNSKYLLGIDKEGTNQRVLDCFQAAKEKHIDILENVHNNMAEAIKKFFVTWEPERAKEHYELQEFWDEITEGANLIFCMGGDYAQDDPEIRTAWMQANESKSGESDGICLVTGNRAEIARIHSTVKGVPGAQSSGAALVSFNAPAFESYGKEQSYNAPVGKYAAFAYTTALNYLLSQREYTFQLGDTMVVFWAENGDKIYQDAFCWSVDPQLDNQEVMKGIFDALKEHRAVAVDDIELDTSQRFFIMGLAPNAARLSVRFFYQDCFGSILSNIAKHYERMEIVKPSWEERKYLGVWQMLQETVNQKSKEKKPVSNMAAMVLQAILSGGKYPVSLYSNLMIRIRSEQGRITWGRAAIIKAYLIRNSVMEEGEKYMGVNEENHDTAYVLGRVFSVLEAIQEEANLGINATIRDRYFNAACATPASVFPVLMKLKNSHVKKLETSKKSFKIYYENLLTQLMGSIEEFPKRMTLEEQGRFILGYYHQVQKRYEKKEDK